MEKILLLIVLCLSFSCKKEKVNNDLIGKWKLIEYQAPGIGPVSPTITVNSPDSAINITFNNRGRYNKTRNNIPLCNGSYSLTEDTLFIKTNCAPEGYKNVISLKADTLYIGSGGICYEGCGYSKYIKVN